MMRSGSPVGSTDSSNSGCMSSNKHTPCSPQHATFGEVRADLKETRDQFVVTTGSIHADIDETTAIKSDETAEKCSKLTHELMQISLQQREWINEEIHGVHSMAVPETPESVSLSLERMKQCILSHLRNSQQHQASQQQSSHAHPPTSAYLEVQKIGSLYLHQPSFRLAFLRATLFDEKLAAVRLLGFLQLVRDFLGFEALANFPLSLNQFALDEHSLLRESKFEILPGRDRVGRRITVMFEDFGSRRSLLAKLRVVLYIMMAASEDEETQKKGIVHIVFHNKSGASTMFSEAREREMFRRLFDTIPLRISAVHICLAADDGNKANVVDSFGAEARKRIRFHTGTSTKTVGELETFGIPRELIPINTNDGKLKTQNFLKWINMRVIREEYIARAAKSAVAASAGRITFAIAAHQYKFPGIECPTQTDVLLGRGRPIMHHEGNVNMRELVASRLVRFNAAMKKQVRTNIIEEVVLEIKSTGGRFLTRDPSMNGFWIEVDIQAARQKVGVYFRDLRFHTDASADFRGNAEDSHRAAAAASCLSPSTSSISTSEASSRERSPPSQQSRKAANLPPSSEYPASSPSIFHGNKRKRSNGI